MPVIVAEKAGFCSGVSFAFDRIMKEAKLHGRGFTFGPIVHNEEVVNYLKKYSISVVKKPEEADGAFLAVRSHGVSPQTLKEIESLNRTKIIDLTCPRVRRVQEIAAELHKKGIQVVIFGNEEHPEVKGLIGWTGGKAVVVSSLEEFKLIEIESPSALIAQTTSNPEHFKQIKKLFMEKNPRDQVYDTLCPETGLRQEEAINLAQRVEALVVVGSETSANTKTLFERCLQMKPSLRVSNAGELDQSFLRRYKTIGVTAGASTPPWTIKEVVEIMENENRNLESEVQNEEPKEVNSEELIDSETEIENGVAGESEKNALVEAEDEVKNETKEEAQNEMADQVKNEEQEKDQVDLAKEEAFDFEGEVKMPQVGEQVKGKIARVAVDEAYIDVGSKTDAILPVAEVHLDEEQTLADKFNPEDDVEVTVIETDEQEGKVIVSHKRLARDKRLNELEDALENQEILEGKVKQIVSAGIVVDLGSGIEGFMPGSLVDTRYIQDFNEFKDKEIQFKVLEYDREKGKLILNRRKLMEEEKSKKREETLNSLEVGSTVTGTVKRLTDFGAFVDVGGIDGLVHISELSWERISHPKEVLKVGDEIKVKVLEVLPDKERISLSVRKTLPDPWTRAVEDIESGQFISGRVTRLVNFGAFIEIKPGVEGLAHISQLAEYHVKHPSEILKEGEEVEVKILEVKPKAKRISLSLKDASGVKVVSGSAEDDGAENGNVTLGDVFGDLFDQEDYSPEDNDPEEMADADSEQEGDQG